MLTLKSDYVFIVKNQPFFAKNSQFFKSNREAVVFLIGSQIYFYCHLGNYFLFFPVFVFEQIFMKNPFAKITLFSLLAILLLGLPVVASAQDASTGAPAASKPKHGAPFHGKLVAVDTNAMTLTVGSRTFQITSETRIMKNDKPAILADGVVGQPVTGYYKPSDEGTNLNASSVYFGTHVAKAKAPKKKKAPAPEMTATNAPAATPMSTPPPPPAMTPPPPPNMPPPPPATEGATNTPPQ